MRAGEHERALRKSGRDRGRTAGARRDVGKVRRVETHPVARRHGHARPVVGPGMFHGTVDPLFDLHHLDTGLEQPGSGALEDALQETFEIRDSCHRAEPYQSGRRNPVAAGRDQRHPRWGT